MNIQVHINIKSISIKDRAFNYGDGLFETIHVKNGKPLFITDHIKRLNAGCNKLRIPIVPSKLIKDSIDQSILNSKECIIKIIYSRGLSEHGYQFNKNIIPQLYVIKKKISKVKNKLFISLGYSQYQLQNNSYLSKIKHLNRIEQILGATIKDKTNDDEYILLDNDKKIIECISSNIFFYTFKKNKFCFLTPRLIKCGVDGIMKEQIIKHLRRRKIKILEKDILKKDIIKFDGCFICNVVKGVRFIENINKKRINHSLEVEKLLERYIYE